jgi:acetylornithine deacetylase/succinyl-diaminopimelate desuccinylase-like protein
MKLSDLLAAQVFREQAARLPYPVALQLVTDEEAGGRDGTRHQLEHGVRADFVIAGETSGQPAGQVPRAGRGGLAHHGDPRPGPDPEPGTQPGSGGRGGVSDGRFYGQLGIPAVAFGVGGSGQHGPDEYADLTTVASYYHALCDFLGAVDGPG